MNTIKAKRTNRAERINKRFLKSCEKASFTFSKKLLNNANGSLGQFDLCFAAYEKKKPVEREK